MLEVSHPSSNPVGTKNNDEIVDSYTLSLDQPRLYEQRAARHARVFEPDERNNLNGKPEENVNGIGAFSQTSNSPC